MKSNDAEFAADNLASPEKLDQQSEHKDHAQQDRKKVQEENQS